MTNVRLVWAVAFTLTFALIGVVSFLRWALDLIVRILA